MATLLEYTPVRPSFLHKAVFGTVTMRLVFKGFDQERQNKTTNDKATRGFVKTTGKRPI